MGSGTEQGEGVEGMVCACVRVHVTMCERVCSGKAQNKEHLDAPALAQLLLLQMAGSVALAYCPCHLFRICVSRWA